MIQKGQQVVLISKAMKASHNLTINIRGNIYVSSLL